MPLRLLLNKTVIVFLAVGLTFTFAGFLALNSYLRRDTEDFVRSFFATEAINLQEGQILPTFSRSQKLLTAAHLFDGIALFDVNSHQSVYETGALISNPIQDLPTRVFFTKTIGLFRYQVLYKLNPDLVAVFEARWPYAIYQLAFALLGMLGLTIWVALFTARQRQRETVARWESENRAKLELGTFASQVAHDIRSPLSALKIAVEKLESHSEERQIILKSASRIQKIAENMLSETQTNLPLSKKNRVYDMNLVIASLISEKEVEFEMSPGTTTEVLGKISSKSHVGLPELDLQRILSNLMNNAAEAANNSVKIQVQLSEDAHSVYLTIADNGPGIPREIVDRLGREQISHGKNGTGLGLLSAFKMVEAVGGKINVLSKIGVGTQIRIQLPRLV